MSLLNSIFPYRFEYSNRSLRLNPSSFGSDGFYGFFYLLYLFSSYGNFWLVVNWYLGMNDNESWDLFAKDRPELKRGLIDLSKLFM